MIGAEVFVLRVSRSFGRMKFLTTGLKYFSRKSDEMSKEDIEMIKVIFSAIFEATLKNLELF